MSDKPEVGETWYGNEVIEVRDLSLDCWLVYKTPGDKSENDFIVKVINPDHPQGISIQHAHFAVDLFGKLSRNREDGEKVFRAILEIWHRKPADQVLSRLKRETGDLPGYDLEYFLYTYDWILEQEDINYGDDRPAKKQNQIDGILGEMDVEKADGREGSQLAISLLCDVARGEHPVEALRRANLDIKPQRWG